jgi:uncharacterized RDD family membrane protein YckC
VSQDAPASSGYAGLVTRAVALVVDAAVIDVLALLAGGAVTLIASLFGHRGSLSLGAAVLGGFAWVLWAGLYFVTFWSLTGQTPGDRMLGIRVMTATGGRIRIRVAVPRFVGLLLCLIPLGAGFLPVLFDDRRRGLHDRLAGTVVRWQEAGPPQEAEPEPDPGRSHPAGQSLPA